MDQQGRKMTKLPGIGEWGERRLIDKLIDKLPVIVIAVLGCCRAGISCGVPMTML
jgi:hypothetical protein